jgi:hypothetical protein
MQEDHMSANSQPVNTALPFPRTSERLLNSREVAEWLGVSIDWVQAHATRRNPRIPACAWAPARTDDKCFAFVGLT